MRKTKHFLLMAVMLLCCLTAGAETLASGSCGENLTWTLTDEGELFIGGTGAMPDFVSNSDIPWYTHRTSITKITIQDGVASIGNWAFAYCGNLTSITIPNGVVGIGDYTFSRCN